MSGKWRARAVLAAVLFGSVLLTACGAKDSQDPEDPYEAEIEAWRKGRIDRLLADNGYLTITGLFWLDEGEHTFGSAEDNDLVFTSTSMPAHAGVFVHSGEGTTVRANPDVEILHEGEPVTEMRMVDDTQDGTTVFTMDELSFVLIQRANRFGIRVRDPNSVTRKNFSGIQSYPIDDSYRVVARFEPYDPPKEIPILDEVGLTSIQKSPGAYLFTLNGRECRLDPIAESLYSESYFVIFRDLTSGDETYGAGRYLYTDPPVDGKVVVDFNKAYNPPCTFSTFTTCPLPPLQNGLNVAVRAGEKAFDAAGKPLMK